MKKKPFFLITPLMLLFSLYACRDALNLRKQSLIQTYYESPNKWAGIKLGESTTAEVKDALADLDVFVEGSLWEGERNYKSDNAICGEFVEGYREDDFCIWFIENIAQFIEFGGGEMTLEEIQTYLGSLEKISVFTIYHGHNEQIQSDGLSLHSGYILSTSCGSLGLGNNPIPDTEMIDEDTVFQVYLTNPEYIDSYYVVDSGFWNFFFIDGGFQDWHGYGEYEVIETGF